MRPLMAVYGGPPEEGAPGAAVDRNHGLWSSAAARWSLDRDVLFLNHGSFGACPTAALQAQHRLRRRMESEPVRFFVREVEPLLDAARQRLADFVGADTDGLVFVDNATTGVNTALQAAPLVQGDRVLVTDHAYNACRNALDLRCAAVGAEVDVVASGAPFDAASFTARLLGAVTPRTRLALLDHVTSATACVLPIADLVRALSDRDVEVIVDGAHAPGQVALDVQAIDAAFYTGNLHKWTCAPKGAAFLWVREDWRDRTRPLVTSHGHNAPAGPRPRLHTCFDWTGTRDPSAWLAFPTALDCLAETVAGGWPALMARNHAVAVSWQRALVDAWGASAMAPPSALGAMAAVRLPPLRPDLPPSTSGYVHPLQDLLWREHRIEVPVMPDPGISTSAPTALPQRRGARGVRAGQDPGQVLLRVSAQVYLSPDAISPLIDAVRPWLAA